jgi:Wax ester synthase/diacylglycerol acyltransferase catalytic domain
VLPRSVGRTSSDAERLVDGRLGMVGKAHHCMVDGLAAVELTSILLDPTPDPPEAEPDRWAPEPGPVERLGGGVGDRLREAAELARLPEGDRRVGRRARPSRPSSYVVPRELGG